jgi:hypothetical protein
VAGADRQVGDVSGQVSNRIELLDALAVREIQKLKTLANAYSVDKGMAGAYRGHVEDLDAMVLQLRTNDDVVLVPTDLFPQRVRVGGRRRGTTPGQHGQLTSNGRD